MCHYPVRPSGLGWSPGRPFDRTVSEPLRSGLLRDILSSCDGHGAAAIPSGGTDAFCASGEESRQDETHGLHEAYVAMRKAKEEGGRAQTRPRALLCDFSQCFGASIEAFPLAFCMASQQLRVEDDLGRTLKTRSALSMTPVCTAPHRIAAQKHTDAYRIEFTAYNPPKLVAPGRLSIRPVLGARSGRRQRERTDRNVLFMMTF